jgi:TMEM175 potassium channel family protein
MLMQTHYSLIAGRSLERLSALSDGIFAVAMTLLVLELHVPVLDAVHTLAPIWTSGELDQEVLLGQALAKLGPSMSTYLMSFMTLGIFWLGQQAQLNHFKESTRVLSWIHIGFLCAVALLPFSTSLLAQFITYRLALGVYWVNLLLLGVLLMASISYAGRADLLREELPPPARLVHSRRILSYQVLYALAFLLSVINTYISIGVLIGLQFHSILGMELPFVRRGLILAAS